MSRKETCILANMCMICNGDQVLVQMRMDPNWSGITFPGGHVEPGESFVDSVIREVREETGLAIDHVQLCGVKQWTQKDHSFRYIVFFYTTNSFSGNLRASDEGDVFWVDRNDLYEYILAEGFGEMLEVFLHDDLSENYHWWDGCQWNCKNR